MKKFGNHCLASSTVRMFWLLNDGQIIRSLVMLAECCAGLHVVLSVMSYHWNALKCAFLHLDPSTHDGEEYKSEGIYLKPDLSDEFKIPVGKSHFLFAYFWWTLSHRCLKAFWFVFSCIFHVSMSFFLNLCCIVLKLDWRYCRARHILMVLKMLKMCIILHL